MTVRQHVSLTTGQHHDASVLHSGISSYLQSTRNLWEAAPKLKIFHHNLHGNFLGFAPKSLPWWTCLKTPCFDWRALSFRGDPCPHAGWLPDHRLVPLSGDAEGDGQGAYINLFERKTNNNKKRVCFYICYLLSFVICFPFSHEIRFVSLLSSSTLEPHISMATDLS